ncbi:non-ribosomal peptide synthetase [Pseudoalteromonas umbrosa]|uniref:non-ribosomal peptide synthetase n=1 Tax=Pseudoalteromonas umbrosa TaxID=3048489 RepID=UPI0024C29D99|nr:non-ribosomal peptide synthetase [Pseudoalteromonas sp. B95]MDK1290725.1 amino acid adenylation domain-containing protein [Pseudoalteromonas sp. B95]
MSISLLLEQLSDSGIFLFVDNGKLGFKAEREDFPEALKSKVIENKEQIIEFLSAHATPVNESKIPKQPEGLERQVLSHAQQRLWFIDKLNMGSAQYNMPIIFEFKGALNLIKMQQALDTIIERHKVLRTVYIEDELGVYQRVLPLQPIAVDIVDLSGQAEEACQENMKRAVASNVNKPFDLQREVSVRANVFVSEWNESQKAIPGQGVVLFVIHHIAADAWSMDILKQEFFSVYNALDAGQSVELEKLDLQYSDYAAWQQSDERKVVFKEQLDYWHTHLDGIPATHSLPLDFPRPEHKKFDASSIFAKFSPQQAARFKQLATQYEITPFMLFHAALAFVLTRHSNKEDIVIGMSVANRMRSELTPIIGFFVNALALRVSTHFETLAEYLTHVKNVHVEAQNNQEVPFEQVVERLKLPQSNAYSPLIQIMLSTNTDFGLEQDQNSQLTLSNIELSEYSFDTTRLKFDLDIDFNFSDEGIVIRWLFDTALFMPTSIQQLSEHLTNLIEAICSVPSSALSTYKLDDISMITQQELSHQLNTLNEHYQPLISEHSLVSTFEQQVTKMPDKTAVVIADRAITYCELGNLVNKVTNYLCQHDISNQGKLIGLCCEPSIEMIVGMLAILKSGAGFVPIAPDTPKNRLEYIIADTGVTLTLTHHANLPSGDSNACFFAEIEQVLNQSDDYIEAEKVNISSSDIAYVIYTSGSTGTPKGVMVEHRNLSGFASGFVKQLQDLEVNDDSPWLWHSSFVFDASLKGLIALVHGRKVVLATKDQARDAFALAELIEQNDIDVFNAIPSLLALVVEELKSRYVYTTKLIASGEHIPSDIVELLNDYNQVSGQQFINAYGPTETTVNCVYGLIEAELHIGRPSPHCYALILDEKNKLTPFGGVGELHIGGSLVARGYLNNDDLTKRSFIDNPYCDNAKQTSCHTLYKTGDLVRYLPDGRLQFCGRKDAQLKINGYRIESAEIEHHLTRSQLVDSALVIAESDNVGGKTLVAYLQTCLTHETDELQSEMTNQVISYLKDNLPIYMLPNKYIWLKEWPLTPGGKINIQALPKHNECTSSGGEITLPYGDVEIKLVAIWADLLNLELSQIGTDKRFFELGGNSLLSVRLVTEIRKAFGVNVSVRDIFEVPTIQGIAGIIQAREPEIINEPKRLHLRESTLSFSQQRLWLIDKLQGQSSEYNMPLAFEVAGEFDLQIANLVFDEIIERHEILRSIYLDKEEGPVQQVQAHWQFVLEFIDISVMKGDEQRLELEKLSQEHRYRPFNLSEDLMLRASYVATGLNKGVLLFNMHHIASDGWSMRVLVKEFVAIYSDRVKGKDSQQAPLSLQYSDYAQWQKEWLDQDKQDSQLQYWHQQLSNIELMHGLRLDKSRPEQKQYHGHEVTTFCEKSVAEGLKALACLHGMTPFMLVHGFIAQVLSRHSHRKDIVIGTPVANRSSAALSPLIGFFVNSLVLKVNTEHQSLSNYLQHVKQVHVDAQSNQDVPFEQIVEHLNVPYNSAFNPVFQIMLTTNTDFGVGESNQESIDLGGAALSVIEDHSHVTVKFDLEIDIQWHEEGLSVRWHYDTALFDAQHIEQIAAHLKKLLGYFTSEVDLAQLADKPLKHFEVLSESELQQLLQPDTDIKSNYGQQACIHTLFEDQVYKQSQKIALQCVDETLSYQALNDRANQLAHYLRCEYRIRPGQLIGLCVDRSMDMVIGILAILKSGGAYVPIDPQYPAQRMEYMLEDTGLSLILTENKWLDLGYKYSQLSWLAMDTLALSSFPVENIELSETDVKPTDLAYIIYTSGSTGKPKGVMVEHHAVSAFALDNYYIDDDKADKILSLSPYSFDGFIFDCFYTILNGSTMYMLEKQAALDLNYLAAYIQSNSIDALFTTTALFQSFVESGILQNTPIKQILFGGEKPNETIIKDAVNTNVGIDFIHVYGPTETVVFATAKKLDEEAVSHPNIAIGSALAHKTLYVLDHNQQLVPFGCCGELYIGGPGMAKGYLNQPSLTSERFVRDPFSKSKGARLYRTGDLVRYQNSRDIEFIGRTDDQVKIRGFRIELGEIEHQIHSLEGVTICKAVMVDGSEGEKSLAVYIVPEKLDGSEELFLKSVQLQLKEKLPEHMQPKRWQVMSALPLTVNGKVNIAELPEPTLGLVHAKYVAPSGDVENKLVQLCSELMKMPMQEVSMAANFFELGGHSLLAVSLINRIKKELDIELPIRCVFESKDLSKLAQEMSYVLLQKNVQAKLENAENVIDIEV